LRRSAQSGIRKSITPCRAQRMADQRAFFGWFRRIHSPPNGLPWRVTLDELHRPHSSMPDGRHSDRRSGRRSPRLVKARSSQKRARSAPTTGATLSWTSLAPGPDGSLAPDQSGVDTRQASCDCSTEYAPTPPLAHSRASRRREPRPPMHLRIPRPGPACPVEVGGSPEHPPLASHAEARHGLERASAP
jgi:hypothetical protein